jgi:acyl carrier protein
MPESACQVDGFESGVQDVVDKLKALLVERVNNDLVAGEIDENASIFEGGLNLDSIMVVEFISMLEDDFGLAFSEAELSMEVFASLRTLAEFVTTKKLQPVS